MGILIRFLITAAALLVAVLVVPGIYVGPGAWWAVLVMTVVLALVNAIVKPILALLSCGCIVLTLGIFLLFINAFTLWLSSWIAQNWFGAEFVVDGFWPAFWGGIVVGIVSFLLSLVTTDGRRGAARSVSSPLGVSRSAGSSTRRRRVSHSAGSSLRARRAPTELGVALPRGASPATQGVEGELPCGDGHRHRDDEHQREWHRDREEQEIEVDLAGVLEDEQEEQQADDSGDDQLPHAVPSVRHALSFSFVPVVSAGDR
ncbi:MAG TPA: phage holin family protein, partial [Thermoleophilia bacterium]|nr:phage holin family protein [Thermoleophilia bacterium]